MNDNIERVIEEIINPKLLEHNGWIELVDYKDNEVIIRFRGACSGCGAIKETLDEFITPTLKEIKEIEKVTISEDISEELIDLARKLMSKSISSDK